MSDEARKLAEGDRVGSGVATDPRGRSIPTREGGLRPRWYRRGAFWRAVAGMALAIGAACAIVAAEIAVARPHHRPRHHARHGRVGARRQSPSGAVAPSPPPSIHKGG